MGTNSADHVSFRKAGLGDSFTVTRISDKDEEVAYHYYKAQEFDVDKSVLREILAGAPIFAHYHSPTDLSIHLSEASMVATPLAQVLSWDQKGGEDLCFSSFKSSDL